MLADDVALRVVFQDQTRLWLARFRIDNRHSLLRCAGLAATADAGSFYRRHRSGAGSSFGYEVHNSAYGESLLRTQHLIESFRRTIEFNLRLHQPAFEIGRRRNDQGHLEWRHLRSVSLAVTFIHQLAARGMLAGLEPRFRRRDRILDGVGARIPDFRRPPALAFAAETVISTQAQKFGGIANPFAAQLRSQVGKIDVAGVLVSSVNPNVAAGFASAVIIGNRSAAAFRRKPAAGRKTNVLHPVAKRGVHHQRLERRAGHVVFVQRAIQERLLFFVTL